MDNAISIYLGGEKVYAKNCNFNSYLELGLICPVCKQEVYLRRGDIREPYFAHLHASNYRQVKPCSRRVSSDETATETNEFIQDRGQRLKIFQDHFLSQFFIENLKIVDDVNFKKWINLKKVVNNKAINNILLKSVEYFIIYRQKMTDKYIINPTKIKDKQTLLQQQIALQVMSYLCENANFNSNLRYLLSYSIFQLYRHNQTKDIDKICQYTMNIIMCNPWTTVFKTIGINNNNNNTTQSKILTIKKNNSTVVDKEVTKPAIQTELELTQVAAVSALTSNYDNNNDLAVSGSGQDSLFWLRRVSIEITNQVLSEQKETRLKQLQLSGDNSINDLLTRSEQFKSFLTFRCETLSNDDQQYFTRINWIIETDPTWGDTILSPDWEQVRKIKFSTIIRILKYRTLNPLLVNNDCLHNRYFGKDEILQCPLVIALDLLTNHIGVNHNNSVIASALKLDLLNVDRTVFIRKLSNGSEIHKPLHTTFVVPCERHEAINNSVTVRSIGKVKKAVTKQRTSSKPSNQRDVWQLLSVNRSNVEAEIIAINSATYRDCVLVFKKYELEQNQVTKKYDHPEWLLPTQKQFGILNDTIIGYVGIKYQSGKVDKLGIIHTKEVKNKTTKNTKTVLWFTLLQKTATKQINRIGYATDNVGGIQEQIVMVNKMIKNSTGKWEQQQIATRVPVTQLTSTLESKKIEIDRNIAMFLSLYGLSHNSPVKPAKMNTINNEQKHINVNWSVLTGLRVAPMNKAGEIKYDPKYGCPFTVVAN